MNDTPPVCDYEGSGYRTDFWEGRGREYEDLTERSALRRLLPAGGRRVAHLGAGFGRMTGELSAFDQVIVLDYSRTMLRDARARLGDSGRYVYVAADIYRLPLAEGSCDAAVMERVIHHMADVPAALRQIRAILAPARPSSSNTPTSATSRRSCATRCAARHGIHSTKRQSSSWRSTSTFTRRTWRAA